MRKLLSNFFSWLHKTYRTRKRAALAWLNNAEIRRAARHVKEFDREELLGFYARGASPDTISLDTIQPDLVLERLTKDGLEMLHRGRVSGTIYVRPGKYGGLDAEGIREILHLPKGITVVIGRPPQPKNEPELSKNKASW